MESVLKRIRLKAYFFLKGDKISDQNNLFGLPSNKTPPIILEMKPFENDVINLIENIKFRNAENQFQISLANDLKKINSSPNIFVLADKTRNIYDTPLDTYNKLMHDNITKTYKHGSEGTISQIGNDKTHLEMKQISRSRRNTNSCLVNLLRSTKKMDNRFSLNSFILATFFWPSKSRAILHA